MDWDYLIQHALLRLAFLSLILGVSIRIVFFLIAIIKIREKGSSLLLTLSHQIMPRFDPHVQPCSGLDHLFTLPIAQLTELYF